MRRIVAIIMIKEVTMHKETEFNFIHTYIQKNQQDRLRYEFNNPKKRIHGICRFCHNTSQLLHPKTIVYHGTDTSVLQQFLRTCKDIQCYVLSFDEELDGTWQTKDAVFSRLIGMGMPSIAVFSDSVIIETEQVQGAAEKWLLTAKLK